MLRDGQKSFQPKRPNPVASPPPQPNRDSDEESTPAPEYRQSFSDAFQAALDKITLQEPTGKFLFICEILH